MDSNLQDWPPALGRELIPAIDQAMRVLDAKVMVKVGATDRWANYGEFWRTFLQQSRPISGDGIVKLILKGDLAAPLGVNLDQRFWHGFISWYERNMREALSIESQKTGIPLLVPARWSDKKGGYSDKSEAIYYLNFGKVQIADKYIEKSTLPPEASVGWREIPVHILRRLETRLMGNWVRFSATKIMDSKSYGIGMVLLAILLLELCIFLPVDDRRTMFIGFALITGVVGFWSMGRHVPSTVKSQ